MKLTLIILSIFAVNNIIQAQEVTVLTVATEETHGLERYLRSASEFNIDVEVLGRDVKWTGGNMEKPGGGQKINLLKKKLNKIAQFQDADHIIIFTDSYDVMFLAGLHEIVQKFKSMDTNVLFGAEQFCWPDVRLAGSYPNLESPNPYLNSGGFIGYLPQLLEIFNYKKIKNDEDDQLYLTKLYLDNKLRTDLKISLDHKSSIFQNLNGALSDVKLVTNTTEKWPYLVNEVTGERPLIVHGNGPSKQTLNQFGNYLAHAWSMKEGCVLCKKKRIKLEDKLPTVLMAIFVETTTPFFEEFLKQVIDMDYPKEKIHLIVHNNVDYHEADLDKFFQESGAQYASSKRIKFSDSVSEAEARNIAMERCANRDCDYMFSLDSLSRLNKETLRYLLASGYDVIAPMIVRPGQAWSNFWGGLNSAGYYARTSDYLEIVLGTYRGIWNVPFITNAYLVNASILRTETGKKLSFVKDDMDPDMAICHNFRKNGIFMHVSNEIDFGHLVNPETYDITLPHPDIYQVIDNRIDWERRYLHKDYYDNFNSENKPKMPCPDVYWFPVMSMRFCSEWISVMEAYGKWSDGSTNDKRLQSGYEPVPTRDIHMSQVGLEKQWLYILKEFVRPLQEMVFIGYYHNPPVSSMNFVVRYRPDEQPSLRPHHDSSTYTINLALNTPNVDYEGGGCRFIRYNCSVKDTRPGWLLMHPGRLTHFHEGLMVTKGTRYIMISFVDP